MNVELKEVIRVALLEAEQSGGIILTSPEGHLSDQLTERIEALLPSTFSQREAEGIVSLIREALWGASSFYDSEMKDTLVGLSELEFKEICRKLRAVTD